MAATVTSWENDLLDGLRVMFTQNGKREFVPRDQVLLLIVVYCLLLLLTPVLSKRIVGLFLSAYFLFWEILSLNLTFVVCRKHDS